MEVFLGSNEDIILRERKSILNNSIDIGEWKLSLTGLWRRTEERKSLRISLISGCSVMYSSCWSISSTLRVDRYASTSLSKFMLDSTIALFYDNRLTLF